MASGAGALAIAHRGDPVRHRENTLPAIAAAVEQGADLVEIDVRLTGDGTVVLLHDETLEHLWGIPAPAHAVVPGRVEARLEPEEVAWCGAIDALAQVRAADPAARVLLCSASG